MPPLAVGPYVASNDITVFSILDTGAGTVQSYFFSPDQPKSKPTLFDEFKLPGASQGKAAAAAVAPKEKYYPLTHNQVINRERSFHCMGTFSFCFR